MKLLRISIFLIPFLFVSCNKDDKDAILSKYQRNNKNKFIDLESEKNVNDNLYERNLENINNGYPFYIIQRDAVLILDKPHYAIPNNYCTLKFGDVVYPLKESKHEKYFFYVKTIDGKYGWINSRFGISLNFDEDRNLYYFNNEYYLKRYKESNGNSTGSDLVILAKNVVPMLLENFKTDGWFYPRDYNLAKILSEYALSISKDQDTLFLSASAYDWRVNEVVIANNLLSDCYHKLKQYDDAIAIHEKLLKSYFWKRSDNSQISGLNSSVKLTKIYIDKLKDIKSGTSEYLLVQKKIIDTILITGDSYNIYTVMDKEWHLSAAEWLLVILQNNLSTDEFYIFCNLLMNKTISRGFSDLVLIYKALALYRDGKQEESVKILKSINSKDIHLRSGKIESWLTDNKIIPDSVIYQYNF